MSCNSCSKILKKHNVTSLSDFRKWSVKNHPDKGGDENLYKEVNNCNDLFFKNKTCDWEYYRNNSPVSARSYYYSQESPFYSSSSYMPSSRSSSKSSRSPKRKYKPCGPHQYRDPNTKRCRNKNKQKRSSTTRKTPTSPKRKPCRSDQYRHPVTKRCRKRNTPTSPKRKPCRSDQYRHPDTMRCRKKPVSPKSKRKTKSKDGKRRDKFNKDDEKHIKYKKSSDSVKTGSPKKSRSHKKIPFLRSVYYDRKRRSKGF